MNTKRIVGLGTNAINNHFWQAYFIPLIGMNVCESSVTFDQVEDFCKLKTLPERPDLIIMYVREGELELAHELASWAESNQVRFGFFFNPLPMQLGQGLPRGAFNYDSSVVPEDFHKRVQQVLSGMT
jgi:hypothetical protein